MFSKLATLFVVAGATSLFSLSAMAAHHGATECELGEVGMSAAPASSLELTHTNSGRGEAYVYTGGTQASVEISGEAARVLYESLDVNPRGSLGIVQTMTKKLGNTECTQSIMGDTPGQMSGPHYSCAIVVDKK